MNLARLTWQLIMHCHSILSLSQVLVAYGVKCTSEEIKERDHFDIIEKLQDKDDPLMQVMT